MKKQLRFSLLTLTILSVNLIFTSFSYASSSSCKTCTTSPSQLTQYISSMKSIASSVKSKTSSKLSSKATSSIYVYSKLLFAMPIEFLGEDLVADFKVIYNWYPAVRDRKKVLALDRTLWDATRELASNWWFDEEITSSDRSKYSSQIKQLKLLNDVEIQEWTTYWELIWFLGGTQKIFKQTFLSASFSNVKKDYDLDQFVRGVYKDYKWSFSSEYDYPALNSNFIKDLQEAYRCSLDTEWWEENWWCPDKLDDFLEDIEDIIDVSEKITKIDEKLTKAWEKLQNLLKWIWSRWFKWEQTERKKDLVKFKLWWDLKDLLWDWDNSWLWSLGKVVQDSSKLKSTLRDYAQDSSEFGREAESQENDDAKKNDELNLDTNKKKHEKENFQQNMRQSFDSVLKVQSSFINDIPMETPEPSITTDFPELSKKVYKATKEVKDATKKLWEACENQCKNAEWSCYYDE